MSETNQFKVLAGQIETIKRLAEGIEVIDDGFTTNSGDAVEIQDACKSMQDLMDTIACSAFIQEDEVRDYIEEQGLDDPDEETIDYIAGCIEDTAMLDRTTIQIVVNNTLEILGAI